MYHPFKTNYFLLVLLLYPIEKIFSVTLLRKLREKEFFIYPLDKKNRV